MRFVRLCAVWGGLALIVLSFLVLLRQPGFIPAARNTTASPASETFSTVVIDAGHGGQDSGAMASNIVEKDVTLDLARRLEGSLRKKKIATLLTRGGDVYISLADRATVTNRAHAAIFVSLHCNDGARAGATGVETFFAARQASGRPTLASWLPFLRKTNDDRPNEQSQSLAAFIQEKIVGKTQASDRGTKSEQFYVLAKVQHPAVLIETGFLTNKEDAARLADPAYREKLADAIGDGILAYRESLRRVARDE